MAGIADRWRASTVSRLPVYSFPLVPFFKSRVGRPLVWARRFRSCRQKKKKEADGRQTLRRVPSFSRGAVGTFARWRIRAQRRLFGFFFEKSVGPRVPFYVHKTSKNTACVLMRPYVHTAMIQKKKEGHGGSSTSRVVLAPRSRAKPVQGSGMGRPASL